MTRFFIYLKYEMKKGMALIPFFVVSALIAGGALIAAAVIFCAVMDERGLFPKAEVAIVAGSDGTDDSSDERGRIDLQTKLAIGMVEGMESVKSICRFSYLSPKEAAEGLASGKIDAALYMPDGMYDDINTGRNTPVLIRLSAKQEALSQKDGRLLVHTKGGRVFAAMNQDGELRTTKSIIPGKDAEMQVSKNRTAETTTILQWNEADITNAVSASGKTLEGPEEIRKALDEKQQVFLYTKDEPEYPHVVEKRGEEYAVSKYGQEVDMQWGGTSLLYAKDVDGNEFRSPEAIQSALESGNGRLLVHLKDDPDDAYMLQKREDGVYLSNDPVKSGNAMNKDAYKKLDGEPAMVSKKSLSEDDFLHALGKGDTRILLYTKADPEPFLVERKKDRFYTSTNTMGKLERLMQEAKTTDLSTLDPEMFTSEEKKLSTVKRSFDNFTKGMDEVLFAIDDQGKIYGKEGKTEEIHSELSKEGRRLFVFEKDGMSGQVTAKAMENRNGELFVSNGPVDGRHKMQDTPAFAPKASVKVDDIIKAVDPTEHERRLDDVDASKRKMDALKLNMDALDKAAETRKTPAWFLGQGLERLYEGLYLRSW